LKELCERYSEEIEALCSEGSRVRMFKSPYRKSREDLEYIVMKGVTLSRDQIKV